METGRRGKSESRGREVGLSHVPLRRGITWLGRAVPPRTSNLALFYLGQKLLIALPWWYQTCRLCTANIYNSFKTSGLERHTILDAKI